MEVICMNIRDDIMAKSFAPRSISSFPSSTFTSCTPLLRDLKYLLITCYQVEISIGAVEKPRFNLGKMNGYEYLLVEITNNCSNGFLNLKFLIGRYALISDKFSCNYSKFLGLN